MFHHQTTVTQKYKGNKENKRPLHGKTKTIVKFGLSSTVRPLWDHIINSRWRLRIIAPNYKFKMAAVLL